MRFVANENVPRLVVSALRDAGHDVFWVRTEAPGADDPTILARATADARVVLTFDKDFGELAFRARLPAASGVILLRMSLESPTAVSKLVVAALEARTDWSGHFSVVEEGRVRMVPLPPQGGGA